MSDVILSSGQQLRNVHPEAACVGRPCPIHAPSDHEMVDWPQVFERDTMYRVCEHGCRHRDPDELAARDFSSFFLMREAVASVSLSHPETCDCVVCRAGRGDEKLMRRIECCSLTCDGCCGP